MILIIINHKLLIKKKIFLKNIYGYDLFNVINKSSKIISPEGIMTIWVIFAKPILAPMYLRLKDRRDLKSNNFLKNGFSNNYEYTVLKKILINQLVN